MSFKNILVALFLFSASVSYSQYDPDYNASDEEDLSQLAFKDMVLLPMLR